MKKKLSFILIVVLFSGLTSFGQTLRIEDTDAGTVSYDGSLKSYSNADNGTAINLSNNSNKRIVWSYNASSSGAYELTWRYTRKASMSSSAKIYVNGSQVQQISLPETAGSVFTTYSISTSLNSGVNEITMETVDDAEFADIDWIEISGGGTATTYTLTASVSGQGSVSPSSGTYNAGTSVTLTATPASGWKFDNWSGSASGTNTSTTITMNSNMSVTANFSEVSTGTTTITIQENATGFCSVDGAVESENSGYTGTGYANTNNETGTGINYKVNVSTAGTYTIEIRYASTTDRPALLTQNGSSVASNIAFPSTGAWTSYNSTTFTAYLNAGVSDLRLEAKSGDGLANIDYMTLSGASISSADCGGAGTTYTLSTSVNPSGAGSVSLSPSGGVYAAGTQVTLKANAYTDYTFTSWSGAVSGTSSSTTVTVNSNMSVTANYTYSGGGSDDVDFAMVGYATQSGGTTGGSGGTKVNASTGDQILDYIDKKKDGDYSNGLIIMVNGTITPSNTSATKIDIKECRDVSIIGSGSGAEFNGIGLKVYKSGNIILRNLKVHHVNIGDKDCISIEGPADHIWVDHCELYNVYQGANKDYYDGLLDAKAESEYITYSWNYLHDSWKTMLVGSSDGDDYDRKITAHHNIFENCNSRMPLFRHGTGHFFNNYYIDGVSTAVNSRMGACLRIEANYFENVQNPYVTAYSDEDGYGDLIGNILDNSPFNYASDVRELGACNSSVPYSYSSVLNSASSVPTITRQNSGVGKLSDPTNITVKSVGKESYTISSPQNIGFEVYPNPFSGTTKINFNLQSDQAVSMSIYDMTGRVVESFGKQMYEAGFNTINYSNTELMPGIYILSVRIGSKNQNTRLVIK